MNKHACYMECGSIINGYTGGIIENPALLMSAETDCLHGWGDAETVHKKFERHASAYQKAGMTDDLEDLMYVELSQYKVSREMACYILRRAVEFTATGFVRNLCREIKEGDPAAFVEKEMARIPIDINEKEWR